MRVFVTGATGFVGAAAARALRERGHAVAGLARSAASAEALAAAGVDPVPGALGDADALRSGVARADAVVHAAFPRHYLDDLGGAIAAERAATAALLAALDGTGKPFVYTSGLGVVGDTGERTVDEDTPVEPPPHMAWRRELELDVLASGHGVVLRPPLVYGHGQGHVLEILVRTALERGAAAYPAPGTNPWPNVHVDDLGRAFALAAEGAPAGALLHVVGGVSSAREMSEAIGRLIGAPGATTALPLDVARRELPIADWMTVCQRIGSRRVRDLLGWRPEGPSIAADLAEGTYRRLLPQ